MFGVPMPHVIIGFLLLLVILMYVFVKLPSRRKGEEKPELGKSYDFPNVPYEAKLTVFDFDNSNKVAIAFAEVLLKGASNVQITRISGLNYNDVVVDLGFVICYQEGLKVKTMTFSWSLWDRPKIGEWFVKIEEIQVEVG